MPKKKTTKQFVVNQYVQLMVQTTNECKHPKHVLYFRWIHKNEKKVSEDRKDEMKSNQPGNFAMSFNRNLQRELNEETDFSETPLDIYSLATNGHPGLV